MNFGEEQRLKFARRRAYTRLSEPAGLIAGEEYCKMNSGIAVLLYVKFRYLAPLLLGSGGGWYRREPGRGTGRGRRHYLHFVVSSSPPAIPCATFHVPRHNKKQVLKRYCSALGVRDTCVICMGLFILVEQHVRAVSRQNTMPFPFV